jgi:hypothetical protein
MAVDNKIKNQQEEIKKLVKIPGKVRGQVFLTDIQYVREKKGEEGISLLKEKIKEWGKLFDYDKVKTTDWYPIGLRVISLLAIKETFNWGDDKITDMGNSAPKYSFIVRMLMKYFLSPEKTFGESPKYWEKHYSIGRMEPYKYDPVENMYILRLHDFKVHPIMCFYFKGYFTMIGQFVQKWKITTRQTRCVFKGDPYCEYSLKWDEHGG